MKRFLWLMCLCSASAFALAACGDDDSGGNADEDGGVSVTDLDDVNDRIDTVDDAVTEVANDLDGLSGNVDDLTGDVDGIGADVDDLDSRVADLENPDLISCSEEEQCIPDGVSLVEMGLQDLVARLCQMEIDCCSEDELYYKFGPGISTVAECTATFVDLINNGLSPDFLQDNGWLIEYVIEMAQAFNDTRVREQLDADAVQACLDYLEDRECPHYEAPGVVAPVEHCSPLELPEENPCDPWLMINGLQEAGELCGLSNLPECVDGTVCRGGIGFNGEGLCAAPAEEGDRCRDDYDCDPVQSELFCNKTTGECQERADEGEDCMYVDPTFREFDPINPNNLYPGFDTNLPFFVNGTPFHLYQNARAVSIECKRGTTCDPVLHECVAICSSGSLCGSNLDCPEDHTCNFTETPALYDNWNFGVCRPTLDLDAPCTLGTECASGRCLNNGTENVCFAALKAEGEACTVAVAGIGQLDASCETGFCAADSTTTTAGKCATRCNFQSECAATHFCNTAVGIIDSTHGDNYYPCDLKRANAVACTAATDSLRDAAAAWNNYQCASGFCDTSLVSPVCAAKSAAGGTCTSGSDAQCPNTQYCNVATCADFVATDAVCVAPTDCGPGAQCWFNSTTATNQCKPLGVAGTDCSAGRQCNQFMDMLCTTVAAGAQCQPAGAFPTGADCDYGYPDMMGVYHYGDTQCTSGWCRASDYTCAEPIAEGADCDVSSPALNRCADGTFCKYPLDEPGYAGECTAQVSVGQSCSPRYSGAFCSSASGSPPCASNCLMNAPCELQNDAFVCSWWAIPEQTLFCDGE